MPPLKHKSLMKEVFRAAGANVAAGRPVSSWDEVLEFGRLHGYPLVVKPDIGVGANGAHRVNGPDHRPPIDNWFDYFVEKYIEGTIETFDGLADAQGNILFYTSNVFSSGIMEVAAEHTHCNYYNQREIPKDLEDVGLRCVRLFNVRERFFHFEFFRTPKGDIVALEANIRAPGGYSMDMMNYAHDMDLYRTWAEMVTGLLDTTTLSSIPRPYHLVYLSRRCTLPYAHSHEEIIEGFGENIPVSQEIHPGISQLGGHMYFFRTKGSIDEVYQFIDFAWERYDGQTCKQKNRGPLYPRPSSCCSSRSCHFITGNGNANAHELLEA